MRSLSSYTTDSLYTNNLKRGWHKRGDDDNQNCIMALRYYTDNYFTEHIGMHKVNGNVIIIYNYEDDMPGSINLMFVSDHVHIIYYNLGECRKCDDASCIATRISRYTYSDCVIHKQLSVEFDDDMGVKVSKIDDVHFMPVVPSHYDLRPRLSCWGLIDKLLHAPAKAHIPATTHI